MSDFELVLQSESGCLLSLPHRTSSKKSLLIMVSLWGITIAENENCLTMITGGEENFFHCDKCECCYSNSLRDSHVCVERAMHHNCPVCFKYLYDTKRDVTVLPCGHTIHLDCIKEWNTIFSILARFSRSLIVI